MKIFFIIFLIFFSCNQKKIDKEKSIDSFGKDSIKIVKDGIKERVDSINNDNNNSYSKINYDLTEKSNLLQENEINKTRAINWLNEKFGGDRVPLEKEYYSFVCFLHINDDGSYRLKTFTKYNENPDYVKLPDEVDILVGNMSNFRYNNIISEKDDNIIFFYAICDTKNCVRSISKPSSTYTEKALLGMISAKSENNIEERSKKAFSDLIKAFGGKKEAY